MSMKFRVTSFIAALFVLPLMLISTSAPRTLMASSMPNMMPETTSMKVSDCLSACGSQLQSTVASISQHEVQKEKEPSPEPAEPYHLQFLRFAPYVALISAAYLLKYLRWRPPDLVKLHVAYRF